MLTVSYFKVISVERGLERTQFPFSSVSTAAEAGWRMPELSLGGWVVGSVQSFG